MTRNPTPNIIHLDRGILEHPQALHIHRMRAAVWLYLVLLSRLSPGSDTLAVESSELARTMGLPEGTIRSWLGHLRKHRYIEARRTNGTIQVRMKRSSHAPDALEVPAGPPRAFTTEKLARSLGEKRDTDALEEAIASYPDETLRRALAGTLAVPQQEIRRSRTALFLYLLKRHAHEAPNNPRP